MARKLVPLEEAAKTLGVSPDELNGMRENRQIYGYRDGASWKFKPEDVERLAQELAERGPRPISDSSSLHVDLGDSDDDGDDIVLLHEGDLGGLAGGSSTVIGAPANLHSPEDSDIKLAAGSGVELVSSGGSSTVISKPKDPSASDSAVTIRLADEKGGGSDVLPVGGSDVLPIGLGETGGGPGSDLTLGSELGGSSGKKGPGSDLTLGVEEGGSSGKKGPGSDLTLGGSSGKIVGGGPGSDLTIGAGDDDIFKLQDDGSSTIRLADEPVSAGPGSDITISPGDSGINLIDPSDSGISLEEPLELSSADDESSFDLSSDSSSGDSSGTLGDSADFDSDAVMELQSEDEFLLTPLEESMDDESQDSGSQVIALDSDTDFDDATPTVMGSVDALGGAMLEPDDPSAPVGFGGGADLGGFSTAVAPGMAMAPGGVMLAPAREARFGIFDMCLLSFGVLMLALGGMMSFDLMRNMWSWEGPYTANSVIMDKLLEMF
ncbi:MAG TPA: helix-turn-helix domain-containing protein [Pirellulales bacterium]|nr:helix-turn-helix domain-containing protein [Pirellulales bacterium]